METRHGNVDLLDIKVKFTKTAARYTTEQKYYHGFQTEEITKDHVEMIFSSGSIDYMARWLLMYGNEATVIYPDELRVKISEVAKEALHHHDK